MERSAWPKSLSSSRKREIQELCGQNPKKLRDAFDAHSQTGDDPRQPLFAGDLNLSVLGSFSSNTQSLSSGAESYEVSQVPSNACVMSGVSKGSESIKTPVPSNACVMSGVPEGSESKTSVPRDRRGCYKRRKTSDKRIRMDHNLIDDGHQWRKYGQKAILNSEFPRNYFRCAYKINQGCLATKMVEKLQDAPVVYRTIYQSQHTCKNLILKSPSLILDSPSPGDSSILVSFKPASLPICCPRVAAPSVTTRSYSASPSDYRRSLRPCSCSESPTLVLLDPRQPGLRLPGTRRASASATPSLQQLTPLRLCTREFTTDARDIASHCLLQLCPNDDTEAAADPSLTDPNSPLL
ncbi:WRKY transcription factor SUSIBA2-like [Eucalyptus grandis]|uniref:WRKY transcription factor SUSIBA2-like n=1 Tax=Eucalyptus grandis TaxID=71139 RepID=UPI00192F0DC5|nr:WRKY transcription factor SUSIBA2-like [Eucalyptus grandis]